MHRGLRIRGVGWVLFLCAPLLLSAQEGKPPGPPPARVVLGEVSVGLMAPESEFVGTVYFKEVSEVASEVNGKVKGVFFEEGDKVKQGQQLVKLDAELLEKSVKSAKANHEEVLSQLEKAKLDLKRVETLYEEKSASEQVYDNARYEVMTLEAKARALEALVARLQTELEKKSIVAPFDAVVIEKQTELGEWVDSGDVVATVAGQEVMEIVVNVPGKILPFIKPGITVEAKVNGTTVKGAIATIVPRGNIATRTFPVKVRVENTAGLIEGMEARVRLPIGEKEKCLLVPRDAVIPQFGKNVVFTVQDSVAQLLPVKVCGYKGLLARIEAEGLEEGMKVVTKGNERLQPGQTVEIVQATQ